MNPLDLNNLPDDRDRDRDRNNGKQALDANASSSSSGYRKKKSGGKDEDGKVYECRFCSLKFCKSQALGGHMNRHRQERETETLNRARQLVFNNDSLAAPVPPHLGCCHPMTPGGYPHPIATPGDPTIPLRYPARMFSGNSASTQLIPPPPPPPAPGPPPPLQSVQPPYNLYTSPPNSRSMPFPSHYPPTHQHQHDYYVGHVLGGSANTSTPQYGHHLNASYGASAAASVSQDHPHHLHHHHQANSNMGSYNNSYTCVGAPVGGSGGGFGQGSSGLSSEFTGSGGSGSGRDGSLNYSGTQPPAPPSVNRFQHGF